MVQPVPPVMWGCWGTLVGGEGDGGRHRAEGTLGCWCLRAGAGLQVGGCPCVRKLGAPIMCGVGRCHPRGRGAGRARRRPPSHPSSLFPACSPALAASPAALLHPLAPLPEPGKALDLPGSTDRRETEKMCWKEALKKKTDGARNKKTVPLRLVFPTAIKTSISAPARATSGRERREGVAGGVCAHQHSRDDAATVPPAALNTRAGRGGVWAAGQGEAGLVKCTSSSLLFTTNKYRQKKRKKISKLCCFIQKKSHCCFSHGQCLKSG